MGEINSFWIWGWRPWMHHGVSSSSAIFSLLRRFLFPPQIVHQLIFLIFSSSRNNFLSQTWVVCHHQYVLKFKIVWTRYEREGFYVLVSIVISLRFFSLHSITTISAMGLNIIFLFNLKIKSKDLIITKLNLFFLAFKNILSLIWLILIY